MNLLSILLEAQLMGGSMNFWITMILIFVIMYFFMIRPQNKKQKEIQNFRKNLEVGQRVVTAGGIHGQITDIEDNVIVLEIAKGVKIVIEKNSIFASAEQNQAAK